MKILKICDVNYVCGLVSPSKTTQNVKALGCKEARSWKKFFHKSEAGKTCSEQRRFVSDAIAGRNVDVQGKHEKSLRKSTKISNSWPNQEHKLKHFGKIFLNSGKLNTFTLIQPARIHKVDLEIRTHEMSFICQLTRERRPLSIGKFKKVWQLQNIFPNTEFYCI